MTVPFLFNDGVLTLILNGGAKVIDQAHPNFKKVRDALKGGTDDELLELIEVQEVDVVEVVDIPAALVPTVKKKVTVTTDGVFYGNEKIDNQGLVDRIGLLQSQGLPFGGMVKFIERLFENMSFRTREELLAFIDRNGLTIDSEGYLICYKAVRSDYMDKYSGKISNRPGNVIEMERAKVDDNFNRHCSKGLHAGALQYVYWYGGGNDRIVIVKIDPADVVSVPNDCSCQKLRTCKYTVIGDYQGELQKVAYSAEKPVDDWYVEDAGEIVDDDFDWEDVTDEGDEEIEDDFFTEGEVQVTCGCEDCECDSIPDTTPHFLTKEEIYGVKPEDSSQAGRRFWNKRGGNGCFAPRQ